MGNSIAKREKRASRAKAKRRESNINRSKRQPVGFRGTTAERVAADKIERIKKQAGQLLKK